MNTGVNVVSSGTTTLIQYPPDKIPLYWVQEPELMIVSRGGDTLAQQISFASAGALLGALPGAFVAYSQFSKDGKIDTHNLIALLIAFGGGIVAIACACVHWRNKSYPEKVLASILERKNVPPSAISHG